MNTFKKNRSLFVDLQGIVEVNVNWDDSFEPTLDEAYSKNSIVGIRRNENESSIKFSIPFDAIVSHMDTEKPTPFPFNNPKLESALEETYTNVLYCLAKMKS